MPPPAKSSEADVYKRQAQRWLRSEIIALNGARPIDLLETETGANVVFEELVRIDYGMFA